MAGRGQTSADDVFINCPFDDQYAPIFQSLIFSIYACGFRARSAREIDDGGQTRIDKLQTIIEESRYGIHDLSRTELDPVNHLPRFNMPLELGFFLGAKQFGSGRHRSKRCLILDRDRYRFQKFISDIAGQDIKAHSNSPETVIRTVRDWLGGAAGQGKLPGGSYLWGRYQQFTKDLPGLCKEAHLVPAHLTFRDLYELVLEWISLNR